MFCLIVTLYLVVYIHLYMPAHEILVLITYAKSECSDEPAHYRIHARLTATHIYKMWKQVNGSVETLNL